MRPLRAEEPREIGPYRVLAEIGEGGMGRVLLATAADGRLVALKVMRPHLLHDSQFHVRFRREVLTSREVAASRWTAAVVASDENAPEPWLASEFFHGPTLAEAVAANGPLDEAAARRLMHGLASALAEIHSYGVVHRDLKPSNVILTEDGVRLIDFGIARVPAAGGESSTITETGALVGAPANMSPEQITGREVGPPSDLFSLAATVITACTGTNPFDAEALFEIMNRVVNNEPDLTAVPEGLRPLVEQCLRKDPAQRISAVDLVARIGEPLAGPWPPAVAAVEERQRAEVADLARAVGWSTMVCPDRTVVAYGPGLVAAEGPAPDTVAYPGASPYQASPAYAPYSPVPVSGPAGAPGSYGPPGYGPPGPYAQMPGGMLPPAPQKDRTGMFVGIAVAVVVLIAGVLLAVNMGGDDDDKKEAGDDSTGSSDSADWEDDDYTSIEEVEPDPIAEAVVGDCFFNYGTETTPDLEESWGCDEGSFEVVDLYPGSSDLSSCDSVTLADLAVSYPAGDLVLCLSYQHPLGDAYHAQPGECVFGPAEDDSPWWVTDCQTGAFRVLERLPGVTDSGSCTEDTYYNHYMGYTTSESYLDVMLCMSFIYPDDAGYATMDNCLYMDGDPESDDTTYTFADCDDSNIYVTGRTDEAWASSFCGNHGWNTWESYDFPIHSYTICWQYL